jgi:hypothetical protein
MTNFSRKLLASGVIFKKNFRGTGRTVGERRQLKEMMDSFLVVL